jgi:predicted nucleotidyltransferase component of viral defense system
VTDSPPIRRFGVRIDRIVRQVGVPYRSVLLDHALTYLLAGIAEVAELRAHLVFKGGTALRKCFFADYRYSEDLDFSTLDQHHWSDARLLELMTSACRVAEEKTSQFGAYSFTSRLAKHRGDHPQDQLEVKVDVVFPTGAQHTVKVEVTQQEPIVRPIEARRVLHAFEGEELQVTVPVYSLDEIILEKLRAFLQVRRSLETRSWTNRSRDLYDVAVIHTAHHEDVRWSDLLEPLRTKAEARGLAFSRADDFMTPEVLTAYRETWDGRLENLVPGDLPDFDLAVERLRRALDEVFGGGSEP